MEVKLNVIDQPTQLTVESANESEAYDIGAVAAILMLNGIEHTIVPENGHIRLAVPLQAQR